MRQVGLWLLAAFLLGSVLPESFAVAAPAMGNLKVECDTKGALVTVDGINVGLTPLKPLPLVPGAHRLKVAKSGKLNFEQKVQIAAGKTTVVTAGGAAADLDLDLDLAPPPAAARKAPRGGDLDLDLDLAPPKPTATAAKKGKGKEPAKSKSIAAPPAAISDDLDLALMAPEPALVPVVEPAPATAPAPSPAPAPAFVADPIAKEAVAASKDAVAVGPTPLYRNTWLWTGVAVAVAAGVAIPFFVSQSAGYEERRAPTDICRDCVVVLNR